MTTTPTDPSSKGGSGLAETDFAIDARQAATLGDAWQAYLNRLRGGEMGALPAALGLIILFIVFSAASDTFLTALNIANLITQSGAICVLAMGLVPVLLLGDIDLSAGVAGGAGAAIAALAIVDHGLPWYLAVVGGLVFGAVLGTLIGALVAKLGIPSFVVTLAFFLALQGLTLKLIGQGGSVRVADPVLRGLTIKNMPVVAGWTIAVIAVLAFAALTLLRYRTQVSRGLAHQPLSLLLVKIAGMGVVVLGLTALLSLNRSRNPNFPIQGVPYVLLLVGVLLVIFTFVLSRTRYGRHVYAVGGNREAARRAGIDVDKIRISVFVLCTSTAVISGILAASYAGKVSPSSGAGNTLLYAVGAAVIGGTSLFGGKGKARDGVIGGVVIATIINGLGLLNQASWINYVVTGAVLLLAAAVDAVSRRRRSASGVS
ncbi:MULTISPECIES: sugar ABC transporter permease [unclassified Aeromicrobium]|uniref:sugar ABC transporter permease n=1 Tax=unclassified Aeromicrobium TaxID=2633570 RepID=UPI0006FF60FC|nr:MULTISPECIES: ABC transporter permease [unclassified Aeromicrobium]KQO38980.1 ABC transporter permease [Aeromicrobium sp. Leaf245]KQP24836.1 ABC transporter permease [Aeromicrobium sp. Leaf272]KQP79666.1 ABC transporter permease [Aeromicrobium sp. Leaf289]KQP82242.1 ABC transporter permease [Aeromicrobium sp. Leaf291]